MSTEAMSKTTGTPVESTWPVVVAVVVARVMGSPRRAATAAFVDVATPGAIR